jgi:transcriptional regulator GlxA family with amidase domain
MDYLRRVRVQQARVLLGDVDLSIKEIARRVGFDDPYHFSKVFHRIDGLPPTLYREALLAGAPPRSTAAK